jgi:hypothetical protein
MQRPPFEEVEKSREAFNPANYQATKTPNPAWKVGQGLDEATHHPRSKEFSADRKKVVISPADLSAGENYKMIV